MESDRQGSLMKAGGDVEADETFIGGLAKNMHKSRRKQAIEPRRVCRVL